MVYLSFKAVANDELNCYLSVIASNNDRIRSAQKPTVDTLKVVLAEFSTLS
jgi:hypothetical protein